jgi:hypothetical protein
MRTSTLDASMILQTVSAWPVEAQVELARAILEQVASGTTLASREAALPSFYALYGHAEVVITPLAPEHALDEPQ